MTTRAHRWLRVFPRLLRPAFLMSCFCTTLGSQQPGSYRAADLRPVETLVEQGRLDQAKAAIDAVLKQNPSSVDAWNLLGIIDTERSDYVSAYTAFESGLHLAPNSLKTHNNLAKLYVTEKWFSSAQKEFATSLRIDPADRDANFNLGMLLLTTGHADEAIPHFTRIHPQDTEVRLGLIRAYLRSKQPAEGLRLATALSHEKENDANLHLSLGVLLAGQNQLKQAEVEIEKADVLKPGTFEIIFDLGQCYFEDRQLSRAEMQFDRALKLKPDSARVLYLLAETDRAESRPLDALDLLVRARKLAPQDADIILLMAQITISQKYFEDAIPLLQEGLRVAPERVDLRSALGESYFKSDKVDKAIEEFNQVIKSQPSAHAYAYLGLSHIYLGRFDEARRDFENGLKLEPNNNFCLFNLGYIAKRQGNSAEAEATFQKVLASDPSFPDALLELANLRTEANRLPEAEDLLKRYIRVSNNPATGYYKLAMVERGLHQADAARADLEKFQELSKTAPPSSYLFEDLFDYLDRRSQLSSPNRDQMDLANLIEENKKHPDQPEILYLLAAAQLKSSNLADAKTTLEQLDKLSASDYRTLTGVGVLLARYHLYDQAIAHFQAALQLNPGADDVEFDLANALFRKGLYAQALQTVGQLSETGRNDNACLALLGDIYAHLGDSTKAEEIYRGAIARNPDNDQDYLSLALLELRNRDAAAAKATLEQGQARIPASGKILWGLGLVSAMDGSTADAAAFFERAVSMLPEWPGSYSTLGVFYFETGQVDKAREVLDRFKNSNAGGLDISRIEQALSQSSPSPQPATAPLALADRDRLLQLALALADRTL